MTLDLDALEAQFNFAVLPMTGDDPVVTRRQHDAMESFRNALPELIRLARIGQRVERDAKETKCST